MNSASCIVLRKIVTSSPSRAKFCSSPSFATKINGVIAQKNQNKSKMRNVRGCESPSNSRGIEGSKSVMTSFIKSYENFKSPEIVCKDCSPAVAAVLNI